MLRKVKTVVFSRLFAFCLLFLAQVALVAFLVIQFASLGIVAYGIFTAITMITLLGIFEKDELNPAYKMIWVLVIILLPVAGTIFYLLWGHHHVPKRVQRQMACVSESSNAIMQQDPDVLAAIRKEGRMLYRGARYLANYAYSPVYPSQGVRYYTIGEEFFPDFLEDLRNAKKYIFLQYYIIKEGTMLDQTLEVLAQKAAEGVDVRLLYDGFGCMFGLPHQFEADMAKLGIRCHAFSPLKFSIHMSDYAMLNHRDHRKITVVDGVIGYTGGLNIADEYINAIERFGKWKDTAVRITGEAVFNMTVCFLSTWDYLDGSGSNCNYDDFRPAPAPRTEMNLRRGYVQPYWDSPLDAENVSENAYLNVINHATRYVYISTPYLILDHEMITNLALAAKSGVDVRILTPGIPDKPTVFLVTQSYYPVLLREGVRIYEYTPGFNHAKMYVSDDKVAIVGSANMDFRSLFLHFENCVSFYGGPVVRHVKADMMACFARSHEVTLEETRSMPWYRRVLQIFAKFFAPLL